MKPVTKGILHVLLFCFVIVPVGLLWIGLMIKFINFLQKWLSI